MRTKSRLKSGMSRLSFASIAAFRCLVLSAVLVAASCAIAQPTAFVATLPAPTRDSIDQIVREVMASQQIPGVSVAVVNANRMAYITGYGFAQGMSQPADGNTVYRLASISKTFTAVAAMQLVELKALDLNAIVQAYVPAFPAKPWPVTVRQLLSHTSGIRHYKGREFYSTKRYTDLIAPLDIFKEDGLEHEPGTKFLYSTYGYNLLGAVVEAAAQEQFVEVVRRRIFEPAGMPSAQVDDAALQISGLATGYDRAGSGSTANREAPPFDSSNKIPGGGFVASANDMAAYAVAIMTDKLMRRETRDAMWTRQTAKDGVALPYGLGWRLAQWNGESTAAHSGAQPGFSTTLLIVPGRGCAVVVLANKGGVKGLGNMSQRIAAAGCAS